ncbi:MAG: hypothetical protein IJB00_03610 [Akkermansia sp.]|nr:hypothetical protein [Akkermansia sp.]
MKKIFLCPVYLLGCILSVSCAAASESAGKATESAVCETATGLHFQQAGAALEELLMCLRNLRTEEEVAAALPEISAAVQKYHVHTQALRAAEAVPDTPQAQQQLKRIQQIFRELRKLGESDAFAELVWTSEALAYHLLIQSAQLPCLLHEETAHYIMMHLAMPRSAEALPAQAQRQAEAIRAEAAERHAAFMAAHPDAYAGGNGADTQSAVVLLPLTEAPADDDDSDALKKRLIADYIRAVYPQFSFSYGVFEAHPDGAFFVQEVFFPGMYTDAAGEQKILRFPVCFCCRKARRE